MGVAAQFQGAGEAAGLPCPAFDRGEAAESYYRRVDHVWVGMGFSGWRGSVVLAGKFAVIRYPQGFR